MTVLRRIGLSAIAIGALIALFFWSLPMMIPLGLVIAGVDDVTFKSIEIGFTRARVDALAIGKPQRQFVGTIDAEYSLLSILNRRIDQVRIDGMVVRARYEDGDLFLDDTINGGVDGGEPGGDGQFTFTPPFVTENLTIENSRIDIETSVGPMSVPLSGQATLGDDRLQFDLDVLSASLTTVGGGILQAGLQLSGHLPLAEVPSVDMVTASGRLNMQAKDIVWSDTTERITMTSAMDLTFANGRLTWLGPLALSGRTGSVDGKLSGTVTFDDRLQPVAIESGEAVFDLTDVDLDELTLDRGKARLRIDGALEALSGALTLDLDGLTTSFGNVEVQGIKMQRILDLALDDRILDVTARTESGKISVDRILVVDDGEQVVETGWFTVQWPVEKKPWLRLHLDDHQFALDWGLEIDPVRIDLASSRAWARIEDLGVTLAGNLDGRLGGAVRIRQGRVDLPSANLALAGIESDILLNDQRPADERLIPLTIRAVRSLDTSVSFSPFKLDARIDTGAPNLGLHGTLSSTVAPNVAIDFTGQHDPETKAGALDLELAPLTFVIGQFQPSDLSPILDGVIEDAEGSVALDGRITWSGGRLASDVALLIDNLGFTIGPAKLARINSVIQFDGLAPLTTASDQLLSVGLLDVGLPLTGGIVSMQLRPDGRLAVEELTWHLANGKIRSEPFSFGSDVRDLTLVLKAEQLDLNALLELTPLDELTGEGRIDGILPLTIGEIAAIDGGELMATGPGVLRYTPSTVPGVLQAGGESVKLMLQALENFRYEALKIALDGRTDGVTAIGLHLEGANPDLYDSHPVEFNLNLEGNLANLVKTNLDNYQIPDRIRERIQGFQR